MFDYIYIYIYISMKYSYIFYFFLSTESSSSCVNCSSLMSNCLQIILVIGSCVTFGGFPSKFSKCCFHSCTRSSWMVAFSLAFTVLFLLLTSLTVCHTILDCLSSTKSLTLLIWFCIYSVCPFRYMLGNSYCIFLSFKVVTLDGFFRLHLEVVFTSARFFQTVYVSHVTLGLALCLVGMHSAATSKWALTKFSYSSFGVCITDISWSALNLFLSVKIYLSLISLLLSRYQS